MVTVTGRERGLDSPPGFGLVLHWGCCSLGPPLAASAGLQRPEDATTTRLLLPSEHAEDRLDVRREASQLLLPPATDVGRPTGRRNCVLPLVKCMVPPSRSAALV